MRRGWTETEREECRAAVKRDNPKLTGVELEAATDMGLHFVEQMVNRVLYGEGSDVPVGLLSSDTAK